MITGWIVYNADVLNEDVGRGEFVNTIFYVAECENGHVKHVAVHGDEPPKKMFCPDCRKMLWVNWDATADRFPLTPRW